MNEIRGCTVYRYVGTRLNVGILQGGKAVITEGHLVVTVGHIRGRSGHTAETEGPDDGGHVAETTTGICGGTSEIALTGGTTGTGWKRRRIYC